ncbi:MAG: hypothetical protein BMS9Abin07_0155 [Acidimicrobiia bacterium]|nr:MAG: hypothetical protein BMS9Abin07_0155 [Acidimicrobiia bacterium]
MLDRRVMLFAFALFVLSFADWAFTSVALDLGAVEANPLLQGIVTSPGDFILLKVVLAGAVSLAAALRIRSKPGFVVLSSVVFMYAFLILWNVSTLHRMI